MVITKSKFLIGLECPRCFWKAMHEKTESQFTAQEEQIINNGAKVGNLAKELFSNAIDLSNIGIARNTELTRNSLSLNKVIFEAGIQEDNLYARIDILVPNDNDTWDIVEVKSGTKVENKHIYDVAFQKYVCERAGITINQCYVLHLNSSYIRKGEIDLEKLFIKENVTVNVEEVYGNIPQLIEDLMDICNLKEAPEINANRYLLKEYPCQFDSECWSFLPKNNVSKLYKIKKSKAADFIRKDILEIPEVPDNCLNDNQRIQKKVIVEDKTYINKEGIKKFINSLEYPLYYFDFETFMEPIPRFENCKVYSQIPFQYSLHVQHQDGRLEHYEFLNRDKYDPRKLILESMIDLLGDKGSIIVFNQAFEKARLKELAEIYPEYKPHVSKILERIVDLLVPFSRFDYYNPIQQGSCSIKKVLPAVTGKSYENMDINNGGDASTLYFKATFEDEFSKEEKEKIYIDLLKYCELDTEGMVWIVNELGKLI